MRIPTPHFVSLGTPVQSDYIDEPRHNVFHRHNQLDGFSNEVVNFFPLVSHRTNIISNH